MPAFASCTCAQTESMSTSSSSSAAAAAPVVEDSSDDEPDDFDLPATSYFEDEASSSDEEEDEDMEMTLEERVEEAIFKINKSGYKADIDKTKQKYKELLDEVFDASSGSYVLKVNPTLLLVKLKNLKDVLLKMSEPSVNQPNKVPAFKNAIEKLRNEDTAVLDMISEQKTPQNAWKFMQAYDKIIRTMEKAREAQIEAEKTSIREHQRERERLQEEAAAKLAEKNASAAGGSSTSETIAANAAIRWQAYYEEARQELMDKGIKNSDELEPLAQSLARKKFADANKYDYKDEWLARDELGEDGQEQKWEQMERQAQQELDEEAEEARRDLEERYMEEEELRKTLNKLEVGVHKAILNSTTNAPEIKLRLLKLTEEETDRPTVPTQVYSFYVEQFKSKLDIMSRNGDSIDIKYLGPQPVTETMIATVENVVNKINDIDDYSLPADDAEEAVERGNPRFVTSADWTVTSSNNLAEELKTKIQDIARRQEDQIITNLLIFEIIPLITAAQNAVRETVDEKVQLFIDKERQRISSASYKAAVKQRRADAERKRIARQKARQARKQARKRFLDDSDDSSDDEGSASSSSKAPPKRVVLDSSDEEDDGEGFIGAAARPAKRPRKKAVPKINKGAAAKVVAKGVGRRSAAKKNLVKSRTKKAASKITGQKGETPDISGLRF